MLQLRCRGAAPPGTLKMTEKGRSTHHKDLTTAQPLPGADTRSRELNAALNVASDGRASFQFATWTVFVAQVWLLDFGRPFFTLFLGDNSPLSSLSMSDYAHMAYIYITALCIIQLQEHSSSQPVSRPAYNFLLISFVIGSSMHMVADAVQHRLLRAGAKLHLTVQQQPMLQNVQSSVLESFHLLDYLDEKLGHQIWYLALYLLFLLYFSSCFYTANAISTDYTASIKTELQPPSSHPSRAVVFCALLGMSVLHEWYAVTEAQVFPQFMAASLAMLVVYVWRRWNGLKIDANGAFILLRTILTTLLVAVWVTLLWRDGDLRAKYRGDWLYVPEPWSFVSLHFMNNTQ